MGRRILVIGAGVSGLTTARCLIDAGFSVAVLAEKSAEATPSVIAGALWEWPPAVCGHHSNQESLQRSKQWAVDSYRRFQALSAQPASGVRMATAVFYFRQPIRECPWELAKMQEAARHVEGFEHSPSLIERHGVNSAIGLCDAYSFLAPLVETDVYMHWLREGLVKEGCQFEQRKISTRLNDVQDSLCAEFDAEAIVNCAGLGSMELTGDAMQPLRGALVRVHNDGVNMPRVATAHCIGLTDRMPQQQMVYIIPRGEDMLVLGGIAELGQWNVEIGMASYEPVRAIWRRCQEFLPILQQARIDESRPVAVGLRPYREKNVRLEREPGCRIVHNYGHGGSGFTFSWGCSQEVVSLLQGIVV